MNKIFLSIIIILISISCNDFNVEGGREIINTTKELKVIKTFKGSGLLSATKIYDSIPFQIIDTTLVLFINMPKKDSIELRRVMELDFRTILTDIDYSLIDSLIKKNNYIFPVNEFGEFNRIKIYYSEYLSIYFSYTKGFEDMSNKIDNYKENLGFILKKMKEERYNRVTVDFCNQLVFSVEFDMFKDSLNLFLPFSVTING